MKVLRSISTQFTFARASSRVLFKAICPLLVVAFFLMQHTAPNTITADASSVFNVPPGDVAALIQAIDDAHDEGGINPLINLSPGSVYVLDQYFNEFGFNGLPTIKTNLTINGNGATIARDANSDHFRIFQIRPVGTLTLNNITLVGGYADSNISESDMNGGAILNYGRLHIFDSTVSDNTAPYKGGAIYSSKTLDIHRTTISGNTATGIGELVGLGGGIYIEGSAELTESFVLNNSVLDSNSAGGGIYSEGTTEIDKSVIAGNMSFTLGGGIYNSQELTVRNSTISGNRAAGFGGSGGGIYNFRREVHLINSTISGNFTDGGLSGGGGGIYDVGGGTVNIVSSTVASNDASGEVGGGGIRLVSGSVFLKNTVLAGNSSEDDGPDCLTPADPFETVMNSMGYNLIGDLGERTIDGTPACVLTGDLSTDLIGEAPMLGALADNGGPMHTHALLEGSPAIDHVPVNNCEDLTDAFLEFDQRGTLRPLDGDGDGLALCDVGAFELSMVCGDVDGNGLPETDDAFAILNVILGVSLPDFMRPILGDIDGDGSLTVLDAVMDLKRATGMPAGDGCE